MLMLVQVLSPEGMEDSEYASMIYLSLSPSLSLSIYIYIEYRIYIYNI